MGVGERVSGYSKLRRELDEAGYRDILPLEAFPIVQHLFNDLTKTTQSLDTTITHYAHYKQIAQELEEGVKPFKEENVKLIKENSHLRMELVGLKENCNEQIRGSEIRLRELEAERIDLKLLINRFVDRVKKLEIESFVKTNKIAQLQERSLDAVILMPENPKKTFRQKMEIDSFAPDACPCCIRVRNYAESGINRDPDAVDYLKITDSRIEALQLQIRSLKAAEKDMKTLLCTMKTKVDDRDSEIDKLRQYVSIRPGSDNLVNGKQPDGGCMGDLELQLKSAAMQLEMLQRRNICLERKLKSSILQEHQDFMLGRTTTAAERDILRQLVDCNIDDNYPTHDEMTLQEKLKYLELQLSSCCKEKAELQVALDECERGYDGKIEKKRTGSKISTVGSKSSISSKSNILNSGEPSHHGFHLNSNYKLRNIQSISTVGKNSENSKSMSSKTKSVTGTYTSTTGLTGEPSHHGFHLNSKYRLRHLEGGSIAGKNSKVAKSKKALAGGLDEEQDDEGPEEITPEQEAMLKSEKSKHGLQLSSNHRLRNLENLQRLESNTSMARNEIVDNDLDRHPQDQNGHNYDSEGSVDEDENIEKYESDLNSIETGDEEIPLFSESTNQGRNFQSQSELKSFEKSKANSTSIVKSNLTVDLNRSGSKKLDESTASGNLRQSITKSKPTQPQSRFSTRSKSNILGGENESGNSSNPNVTNVKKIASKFDQDVKKSRSSGVVSKKTSDTKSNQHSSKPGSNSKIKIDISKDDVEMTPTKTSSRLKQPDKNGSFLSAIATFSRAQSKSGSKSQTVSGIDTIPEYPSVSDSTAEIEESRGGGTSGVSMSGQSESRTKSKLGKDSSVPESKRSSKTKTGLSQRDSKSSTKSKSGLDSYGEEYMNSSDIEEASIGPGDRKSTNLSKSTSSSTKLDKTQSKSQGKLGRKSSTSLAQEDRSDFKEPPLSKVSSKSSKYDSDRRGKQPTVRKSKSKPSIPDSQSDFEDEEPQEPVTKKSGKVDRDDGGGRQGSGVNISTSQGKSRSTSKTRTVASPEDSDIEEVSISNPSRSTSLEEEDTTNKRRNKNRLKSIQNIDPLKRSGSKSKFKPSKSDIVEFVKNPTDSETESNDEEDLDYKSVNPTGSGSRLAKDKDTYDADNLSSKSRTSASFVRQESQSAHASDATKANDPPVRRSRIAANLGDQSSGQQQQPPDEERAKKSDSKTRNFQVSFFEVEYDKIKLELKNSEILKMKLEAENEKHKSQIEFLKGQLEVQLEGQNRLENIFTNVKGKGFEGEGSDHNLSIVSMQRDQLANNLKSLQARTEALHGEISKYRLKSIELQDELEATKRHLQLEKREKEDAIAELQRVQLQRQHSVISTQDPREVSVSGTVSQGFGRPEFSTRSSLSVKNKSGSVPPYNVEAQVSASKSYRLGEDDSSLPSSQYKIASKQQDKYGLGSVSGIAENPYERADFEASGKAAEMAHRLRQEASKQQDFMREIAHLKSVVNTLDRDKDEMRFELDKKDEKLSRMSQDCEKHLGELSQMRLSLRNAELQIGHTGASKKEHEREVQLLKQQMDSLRGDVHHISKERDDAIQDCRRLAGAISKEEIERKSISSELHSTAKEADQLRKQLQKYIEEVGRMEDLLLQKEEEMDTLMEHYRNLSLEKSSLESERTSLERVANSIQGDVRDAVDQSITLKNQLQSQNALIKSYEEEIGRLTVEISTLENQLSISSQKDKTAESDVKAARDLLFNVENKMDKLKLDLANAEGISNKLEAENEEQKAHIRMLEDQLEQEIEAQKNLEQIVANIREKEFEEQRTAQSLSAQKNQLADNLMSLQNRTEMLQSEVSRFRLKATELQNELDRTNRQLQSEKSERETAISELRRVQQQLNSSSTNELMSRTLMMGAASPGSVSGQGSPGPRFGGPGAQQSGSLPFSPMSEGYLDSPLEASTSRDPEDRSGSMDPLLMASRSHENN